LYAGHIFADKEQEEIERKLKFLVKIEKIVRREDQTITGIEVETSHSAGD